MLLLRHGPWGGYLGCRGHRLWGYLRPTEFASLSLGDAPVPWHLQLPPTTGLRLLLPAGLLDIFSSRPSGGVFALPPGPWQATHHSLPGPPGLTILDSCLELLEITTANAFLCALFWNHPQKGRHGGGGVRKAIIPFLAF